MKKLIFDSSALIPASKYALDGGKRICEHLVEYIEIHIPTAVMSETIVHPNKFASEAILQALISQKKIIVDSVKPTKKAKALLASYKLGSGEQDAILLYLKNQKKFDNLVLDDYVAAIVCKRLQIGSLLLLDLIVQLGQEGLMPRALAIEMIAKVAPRYNRGFIEHSLLMLHEHKVIRERPPVYLRKNLEAYLAGKFSRESMTVEEADLRQRLAHLYPDYAAGKISLGWMALHLHLSLQEADGLLERMKLPVTTGLNTLPSPSDFRSRAATPPKKYKTAVRRRSKKEQKVTEAESHD
jgi:hypothetical protein